MFGGEWSDTKTWVMGILSALIVAAIVGIFSIERGNVVLSVARAVEQGGRCVDRELFLENILTNLLLYLYTGVWLNLSSSRHLC